MTTFGLIKKSLVYYWRTNAAVVLGVAVAVAVLSGALLVGDSVRASLRDILLERIGSTSHLVTSNNFFREGLANEIQSDSRFAGASLVAACPMIAIEGAIEAEASGLRGTGVRIYGVDERFWQFHAKQGLVPQPNEDEVLLSAAFAQELEAKTGDELLLRVEKPSAIPVESVLGRKDDLSKTVRVKFRGALPSNALGEFSLSPSQESVRAVFISLKTLQRELEKENKVNTILISENSANANAQQVLNSIIKDKAALEDLGIKFRSLEEQNAFSLETDTGLINDYLYEKTKSAAIKLDQQTTPIFSYLANSINSGEKNVPYSIVTAVDRLTFEKLQSKATQKIDISNSRYVIILNEWAAKDLEVETGATVKLDYYVWQNDGRLATKSAEFILAGVVPIEGFAADKDLVPEYPGITEAKSMGDWDPPFPVDLNRIRDKDEEYWETFRTTPKAFILLDEGQKLWQSRFGNMTSIRIAPKEGSSARQSADLIKAQLKEEIEPTGTGLSARAVKAQGLEAARGTTDFGEYFLYFSFFLVVSALLLASLFFRFGVEQRVREIGLLQSVGFGAAKIRRLFITEGFLLSLVGSLLGTLGAIIYGKLIMFGLQTWWIGAVGTAQLNLHINPKTLLIGLLAGVLTALICVVLTLRGLRKMTTRSLLAGGQMTPVGAHRSEKKRFRLPLSAFLFAIVFGVSGLGLLFASILKFIGQEAGFFGGGTLLLVSLLCLQSAWLKRRSHKIIQGNGAWAIAQLGFRNATHKPGRSILCISLIAAATFIVVTVDAFRKDDNQASFDIKSGTGGFPLLAESQVPLVHDPNTNEGKEELLLTPDAGSQVLNNVKFSRFRVRPGDDASCLNLFQVRNPRIIAPSDDFLKESRFTFQSALDNTKGNPWLLLNQGQTDGTVPVIADANSLTYAMHLKVGDIFSLERSGAEPARLRVVGALSNTIFQGELLMSEKNFLHLFPEQQGFRFFLIDAPVDQSDKATEVLEERLADFGFDIQSTNKRLAEFHRVENTYLSTFQMLGALGLALGTLGLAAVLLRNALERRREFALLKAIGYEHSHFALMALAENAFLLFSGLIVGTACALLAIGPVMIQRGGSFPFVSIAALLLIVVICGLGASILATQATSRSPLLKALRSE